MTSGMFTLLLCTFCIFGMSNARGIPAMNELTEMRNAYARMSNAHEVAGVNNADYESIIAGTSNADEGEFASS